MITTMSHKTILACLRPTLYAAVSKALNQRIGFPSRPLSLANRPNCASLPPGITNVLKTIALPGHAPNLHAKHWYSKHDKTRKVKRHTVFGVLALGPWQPKLHTYIICVPIQVLNDNLIAGLHTLLQDLMFNFKLKQN